MKGGYNTIPYYNYVEKAIELLGDDCPVLVNGSIETAEDALSLKKHFGVFGVMIGRAAIRNPWIFSVKSVKYHQARRRLSPRDLIFINIVSIFTTNFPIH